jgi:superfamily II RNA helicase
LDAYGDFAQVREIAAKSFAHRETTRDMNRINEQIMNGENRITEILRRAGCSASHSSVFGLERLVSARARLHERRPQTRGEIISRWLDEVVRPGRVVAIGRSGKRLVMITHRYDGKVQGVREDGRGASFPLERIGRVYSPAYPLNETGIEQGFQEVHERGPDLVIAEPRLRDANAEEFDAVKVLDDAIDSLMSGAVSGSDDGHCKETLWATIEDAAALEQAGARKQALQDEIWEPFERRARVLASFGYLDFNAEKVTERGRWLADLHVDHPLIIGQALESGLFQSLDPVQMGAVTAAITADEDRDYGEIELDDAIVGSLSRFEETGFRVASEEWKYGIEPAPELNFSAAGAAGRWTSGTEWATLVRETRAEEGDLFRMLSRTGEALLQIAGLRTSHPHAATMAARTAEIILREPVR